MALPVRGESFLLQRANRNILVDGGYSSRTLIAALSAPDVAINHLNIVVCTHADGDHAGGITDLLETTPIRVDEFWLPGSWADSLPELLSSPEVVVNALVWELDTFELEMTGELDQDDEEFESHLHARIAEERRMFHRKLQNDGGHANFGQQGNDIGLLWLKKLVSNTELDAANDDAAAKAFARGRRLVRYRASNERFNRQWADFWVGLINTAERIRKIAVQAIRYNVKVRWFDFSEFLNMRQTSGGEKDLLVPLNAIELLVTPSPVVGMSYVARLSPTNEECLVFMSPGNEQSETLGVVFTGDSPLGDGPGYQKSFLNSMPETKLMVIATAPHHGSESNAVAYKHLDQMATVVLWLRSGGTSKHPGKQFQSLPSVSRACTWCPHLKRQQDTVVIQLTLSRLVAFVSPLFRVRARDCTCC